MFAAIWASCFGKKKEPEPDDMEDVPRVTVCQIAYHTAMDRMDRNSLAASLNATPFVDLDLYMRMLNKGDSLLTLMQTDRKTLFEQTGNNGSPFCKPQSFIDSGWTMKENDTVLWTKDTLAPVLQTLNANACRLWDNTVLSLDQTNAYKSNGTVLAPTQANYTFGINTRLGIMGAMHSIGPYHMVKHTERRWQAPPPMHHWSDLAWHAWDHSDALPPVNIWQCNITTVETVKLLNYLMQKADMMSKPGPKGWPTPILPYPGKTYFTHTPEGKALLGTIHGTGVCWLLIDHKKDFGVKFVDRIDVFSIGGRYQMLFWMKELRV